MSYEKILTRRRQSEQLEPFLPYGWLSSLDVDEDGSYDPMLGMKWALFPAPGLRTLLQLLYLDTEETPFCKTDVLVVRLFLFD